MYSLIVENIKCIIAAGGLGTRLQDFRGNKSTKILLDVKGTSMINRQISQLYKWGMRKFVIITNPEYLDMVKEDTLSKFENLKIDFTIQEEPKGISHALYQARDFVDQNEKIFFVLGDNFFENNPFNNFHLDKFEEGACIFTTEVSNPEEFGVAQIDGDGKVLSIEEKPHHPKSNAAVVGIYMFDNSVFNKIDTLEPSERGEYEIVDLCNIFISENKCLNLNIDFTVQEEPKGISHALYQARDYVDQNEKIFFVLGDNFFENNPFNNFHLDKFEEGACIFTTEVSNPEEFGVAEIDGDGKVLSIEEKPHHPKSNAAVVGIYMFDDTVFKKIETLEPSARGEYEVTDLCNIYVNENKCLNLDLNGWWIDAGTPERIIELEEKLS